MDILILFYLSTSGTLHVGDEIREINGISVANQTVEQLQKMLVRPVKPDSVDKVKVPSVTSLYLHRGR